MRSNLVPRLSIAVALVAAAAMIALTASSRPAEALTNCTVSNLSVDAEEAKFLELINDYRGSGDELTISVHLNRSASWMAVDLATRSDNVFSHTDSRGRSPGTRTAQCDGGGGIGENIAAGTYRDTAQEAFDAWKASSGHNSNMLNGGYRQIGIARYYNGSSTYDWYWVTVFSLYDDGTRIMPGASTPTPTPSPSPTPPPSPTPSPPTACAAPVIINHYDTDPAGAGTVTISWSPVPGAATYRVARREGALWVSRGAYSSTTYVGPDGADDPQWRIYVASGSCTPIPGPAAFVDPHGLPPACTAPVLKSDTDTNPTGGGTVTMTWDPVPGATGYRVARREGGVWVVKTNVATTSYSGADAADDPQWRIYVGAGSCTGIPGPATAFDPT